MPNCKHCGTPLDKGEKICPICQTPNPLGDSQDHIDFTDTFKPVDPEYKLVKQKSRMLAFVLALIAGFSGAPFFYLGFKKTGIGWALSSVILVLLMVLFSAMSWVLWVCGGLLIIGNVSLAVNYLIPHDQKDARGEFLK